MKILAIDTSSNVAAAAITDGYKIIGEYTLNHKKTHSQKIMPMIDELMKSTDTDISDIDLYAVVTGPGSFTGLRIGVAAIKSLAQVTKKPVAAVNTLECMAYNMQLSPYLIVPMMDARRRDVYTAAYRFQNKICEVIAPDALSVDECVETVKAMNEKAVFIGDGADVHKDYIVSALGDNAFFAPASQNIQRAASVASCAYDKYNSGDLLSYNDVEPFYIRKSQAEREYDEKHGI